MANIFSSFEDCVLEMQGMTQFLKAGALFAIAYAQGQMVAFVNAITKFSFKPYSVKIYSSGSLLMEQKYNTFSDAYPGLSEQGIIFPITKDEFYAV